MPEKTSVAVTLDKPIDSISTDHPESQALYTTMLSQDVVHQSYQSKHEALSIIKTAYAAEYGLPLSVSNSNNRSVYLVCKHSGKFRPHRTNKKHQQSTNEGKTPLLRVGESELEI